MFNTALGRDASGVHARIEPLRRHSCRWRPELLILLLVALPALMVLSSQPANGCEEWFAHRDSPDLEHADGIRRSSRPLAIVNAPPTPVAPPDRLVIASRESKLALWQAEHVRDLLGGLYPRCQVDILGMTTRGDQILDRTLSKVGGKGLFVKELETAIADGRADFAVHSAKDVPMELPEGFILAAIGEREDARDCLVSSRYRSLPELPPGGVVGTSSLRREAQIRERHPHLAIAPLRGNVQTRLSKLDGGEYDAIVLAVAGLKRLGLSSRIGALLDFDVSLPAPGQGALAIECKAGRDDLVALLAPLHHPESAACVRAERALSRALSGSCQLPLAAHAQVIDGRLQLNALVASPDGLRVIREEASMPFREAKSRGTAEAAYADCEALGRQLAQRLLARGAGDIIAALQ